MPRIANPICTKCGSARVFQNGRYRCRVCLTRTQAERKVRMSADQLEDERVRANHLRNQRRAAMSPERRAAMNAYTQAWRESNRELHAVMSRDWYQRNIYYARAKKISDYRANPEPFLARNFLRKARLLDAVCEHGESCVTNEFLATLYGVPCAYCGALSAEADHFYPLSRGGLHCRDNLVPACLPCNRSKHASDPFDWMASKN